MKAAEAEEAAKVKASEEEAKVKAAEEEAARADMESSPSFQEPRNRRGWDLWTVSQIRRWSACE